MVAKRQRLCVVCPCYNEEEVLPLFWSELCKALETIPDIDFRALFVDDGSTDGTLELLNTLAAGDRRIRVYSLSRNFGHQIALSAGIDHARGDAVILMDCDLQHPPRLLPAMVSAWRSGNEIVSMVRERTEGVSRFKRLSSDVFYRVLNLFSDVRIEPGAADFCLLSRRARRALSSMPERHRFLRGLVSWMGYRRAFLRYSSPPRAAGMSKYTFVKMARLGWAGVLSFSCSPLRQGLRIGSALLAAGVVTGAALAGRWIVSGGEGMGAAVVVCALVLIAGVQMSYLGILGVYLAGLVDESKRRPLYLLKQRPDGRIWPLEVEPVSRRRAA